MAGAHTLYLVDGSAQFHRAYHAIRGLATTRGLPTGAVYGFTTMLRKLYQDEKPEYIAISFDLAGPTFRHEAYKEYKAHRPKMDDDLAVQIPFVRRVCEALRLPVIEVPGFEADDVIATLAGQGVAAGHDVVVVSGDKDLLQLVGDRVKVLNPGREGMGATLYDRRAVEEKFGVPPERVVDVLALVGDAVDNIPGVPGIGDKGARDLVREFGPVEAVLENADRVKRAAYREGLKAHREDALLSKQLATLRADVPVELDLAAFARREPDGAAAHALFTELEFQALAREFAPPVVAAATEHQIVTRMEDVDALLKEARAAGQVSLGLVATNHEPMRARLLGVALATHPGRAAYIPLGHSPLEAPNPLGVAETLARLGPLLVDAGVRKLSAHAKRDLILLARHGVEGRGFDFDALVASYLLNPGRRAYALDDLAVEFLGERRGSGSEGVTGDEASVGRTAHAAGDDAELVLRLAPAVTSRLEQEGLLPIYQTMELPLVEVLADMERAGVRVDAPLLAGMSRDMEQQLAALTKEIYILAKGEFNINSPVQLREVLFDRLGFKSGKKTAKTRAASTAEDVLEELAVVHELPRKILDYRGIQKLKSTYVDALPGLIS
ncbi:MAG TPA: DNA polymerase, partial [Vicinamibacteria bacterium]|nr:DNA polymerase [Vicinamibacteria bacterium]